MEKRIVRYPPKKRVKGEALYHTVLPDGSTVVYRAASDSVALRRQGRIARGLA